MSEDCLSFAIRQTRSRTLYVGQALPAKGC